MSENQRIVEITPHDDTPDQLRQGLLHILKGITETLEVTKPLSGEEQIKHYVYLLSQLCYLSLGLCQLAGQFGPALELLRQELEEMSSGYFTIVGINKEVSQQQILDKVDKEIADRFKKIKDKQDLEKKSA